jgi:hypothetical protein
MRTITLELLRHGPAHNQLLSPLTPYMALCENHGAVTLHVPFEHAQFMHRLKALRYQPNDASRQFELRDIGRLMGDILAGIPGFTAEINKRCLDDSERLIHLRLIISASELALLPIELALAPDGCPGSGQNLVLQSHSPLCVTREVRRAPDDLPPMDEEFRILFIAASPPDVAEIPLEAHLLALRQAIAPWVRYFDTDDAPARRKRVDEHLHFLPMASIEAIGNASATGSFTHVHILAHGVERSVVDDTRYCLALHNARDPSQTDYVSGTRLAAALRANHRPFAAGCPSASSSGRLKKDGPVSPVMVSLASCNSGNGGSVVGAGASIAHDLHVAGIPMVVAGQFPLSFEGSVRLVEILYRGLLWGEDPRSLLHDLRCRLYADIPHTQDWASLTVYAALPSNFDHQLSDLQVKRTVQSIDAAMSYADKATASVIGFQAHSEYSEEQLLKQRRDLKSARGKIRDALCRLETLIKLLPQQKSRIYGLLGSGQKREAEVAFADSRSREKSALKSGLDEVFTILDKSRRNYRKSFNVYRLNSWGLVQYLSLDMLLRSPRPYDYNLLLYFDKSEIAAGPSFADLWTTAYVLSQEDLSNSDLKHRIWAHANLMELSLLACGCQPGGNDLPKGKGLDVNENAAIKFANDMVAMAEPMSFEIYSTRRQLIRYTTWYKDIAKIDQVIVDLANKLVNLFPAEVENLW